jgi:hypothetical protein
MPYVYKVFSKYTRKFLLSAFCEFEESTNGFHLQHEARDSQL